jgi:hypothetical protein
LNANRLLHDVSPTELIKSKRYGRDALPRVRGRDALLRVRGRDALLRVRESAPRRDFALRVLPVLQTGPVNITEPRIPQSLHPGLSCIAALPLKKLSTRSGELFMSQAAPPVLAIGYFLLVPGTPEHIPLVLAHMCKRSLG